jgi:deoxyribose-phosphate aldolase
MIATKSAREMSTRELAAYIDQSVLKPEFSQAEIAKHIQEGVDFGCATVCVNPTALDIAAHLTEGSDTGICVVCDFPFGLSTTRSKVEQAREYCSRGDVAELDVVANYGWIRSGLYREVGDEVRAVTDVCHAYDVVVKVILETDALTADQVRASAEVAVEAGADFLKTSTGFYTGGSSVGASREVIALLMDVARGRCKVKGSGGIRDQRRFFDLIDMGIDRMGIGYRSTPVVLGLGQGAGAGLLQGSY